MNTIKHLILGFLLSISASTAVAVDGIDVCAPFKDGVVDQSVVSKMLAAADDGYLYRIEPATSKVSFCVQSPVGLVEGEFKDFAGGLTFLKANASEDEQALVMVHTKSLETDGALIERMLKGKKFFDVENYPEILFVSTGFQWVNENEAVLRGNLTMHGVTREVGFHVVLIEKSGGSEQEQRIVVKATTLIRRSQFGLTALSPMVSDSVNLCMSVDAIKYRA